MIRFIDLRGQGTGYRFAFFDTVPDTFVSIGVEQVFDDYAELERERMYLAQTERPIARRVQRIELIERCMRLCPEWTKEAAPDPDA